MAITQERLTESPEHSQLQVIGAPSLVGSGLRAAVVHDYLTQRGGAERVVLSLMQAFPEARLITSVYDPESTFPEFAQYDVETTWLDRIPVFRADPRRAMPLLPTVFSGVHLDDVDVVICSSSGWAHGVRTDAPKIVYCHNPARWLYQRHQYVEEHGLVVRGMVKVLSPYLKWWDRRAAGTVTTYLANSRAVADRVMREYGLVAQIVPPAITIDRLAAQEPVPGVEPGFLLAVSRPRGYKNTRVVTEAVESLPNERLVVVGGLPEGTWSPRVQGVQDLSDPQLRWLYANCSAVVAASHEDFGLTPVEGYTFGKPSLCLRAGGYLDTMAEHVSGLFFDELKAQAVAEAIECFRASTLSSFAIEQHSERFGFGPFREALLLAADLAVASHALDPLAAAGKLFSSPREHGAKIRRPASAVFAICLLLTVLTGTHASTTHPALLVLAGMFGVVTSVVGRLWLALTATRAQPPRRTIVLP